MTEKNEKLVNEFLAEIKGRDIVLATKKSALIKFADWWDRRKKKKYKKSRGDQ